MILTQKILIHTGLIIIPFCKSSGNDLHQIGISRIVFCQKYQMMISALSTGSLTVKPGIRRHINFTAENRLDSLLSGFPVKIDHTVHDSVVRDRSTVHAQFFDSGYIFFYFVGTVQKTVLRMDV